MAITLEKISSKRELILRPYQGPAADFAFENDISVLAMCPNGGKTEISIDVIRRFLLLFPKARVLVLTHSTTVLKDNYTDRLDSLNLFFDYSTTFDKNCQVHICLPQSQHLIKGQYDLLIVDEAHENYLAGRIQRIIKHIKPNKQVLLTGTPSKFIKKGGYNIFTLAVNEVPQKYFAKLQIELVTSNYKWARHYNNQLEIKSRYKFERTQTKKTLEEILLKLITKVSKGLSAEEFNNPKLKWAFTYKKLGKTMIICKSVKQASDVNVILKSHNVNSMVSDHKTDKDSFEIANFKNNKYDVLIVVDRARLGFSDEALYNIIDMSGTHNPDIIYQIFCRVLRGTPDMKKYYLKVTTKEDGMMDLTHACVSAALMLTDKNYLSTFNGINFSGMQIPVIKDLQAKGRNDNKNRSKKKIVLPEFTNDVVDMFKTILHDLSNTASIYKLTTLNEVRATLTGKKTINVKGYWTLERCKEDALLYKTRRQWKLKSATAYVMACNNNWLEKCCKHMTAVQNPTGYWTFQRCKDDALKHKTRHAWQKAKNTGYWAAKTNKWLDICCKHMMAVNAPQWTLKTCKAVALKYKSRSEWKRNSSGSCEAARKNGWFEKCCKHMK